MASDLGRHSPARFVLILVVVVDPGKDTSGRGNSVPVGQRHYVEVVPRLVPADDEERLDPQGLFGRRHSQSAFGWEGDLGRFEWAGTNQLAYASLYVTELPEDQLARLHPVRDPLALGFECFKYYIKPVAQIAYDMVVVVGVPMTGIEGGCRTADQNCVRHYLLQPGSGFQHSSKLSTRFRIPVHNDDVIRSDNDGEVSPTRTFEVPTGCWVDAARNAVVGPGRRWLCWRP